MAGSEEEEGGLSRAPFSTLAARGVTSGGFKPPLATFCHSALPCFQDAARAENHCAGYEDSHLSPVWRPAKGN